MPTAAAAAAASNALLRCGLHFISWRRPLLLPASAKTKTPSSLSIGRGGALLLRGGVAPAPSFCTASPDAASAATSDAVEEAAAGNSSNGSAGAAIDVKEVANTLDLRVGRILKAWRHEEADTLYVEEVDVGEADPRIICSGLVKYVPLDLLQGRNVVVLANLKARNMRGVKSSGMLMAASDASHENVELLVPPEGSLPGERIWFGSESDKETLPPVATPNQVQKKKIWEMVQPHLKTDESRNAILLGQHLMRTSVGAVTSPSLKNANIS
ncbi:hypothetical protein CDL15_Pgr027597 [Punica granatum]|uniref:tRNA-binding domain-containing protein n=1 Tax=Punica granatum TaxID=22663 RepID=A0A218XJ57_PUNGR|nr:hypothetical protein CDL15_Pgr027597 [Punica granatum]